MSEWRAKILILLEAGLSEDAAHSPPLRLISNDILMRYVSKKRKAPAVEKKAARKPKRPVRPVKAVKSVVPSKSTKICEAENEDDEEVLPLDQLSKIKEEPQQEEPAPVQAQEQHTGNAETHASQGGNDRSDRSRRKKELEMRLREVELEQKALQIKRQLLEFDD